MKIALFAAFPHELRHILKNLAIAKKISGSPFGLFFAPYPSGDIIIVRTGMGRNAAETAVKNVIERRTPDVVISLGFGGALYPAATLGDLVIASRVLLVGENNAAGTAASPYRVLDSLDIPEGLGATRKLSASISAEAYAYAYAYEGSVVTCTTRMRKSELNALLSPDLPCPVCDMETFFIAKTALGQGVRFIAVRAITDLADEDIPPELFGVSDASGRYRLQRALGLLLRNPGLVPAGIRLGKSSTVASKNLWNAVKSLLETL